jgi:hypothetical protein
MNGTSMFLGYAKISSIFPKITRTLCVGPVTQRTDPSQPNWGTEHGRRKGKMPNHNGGGRFYGNPRPHCVVN